MSERLDGTRQRSIVLSRYVVEVFHVFYCCDCHDHVRPCDCQTRYCSVMEGLVDGFHCFPIVVIGSESPGFQMSLLPAVAIGRCNKRIQ
jgi:hypothetical protein